ncbi:hypothetical protein ACFVVA_33835 [Kitasatospora sp. NPDC058048]|uniref:hypothetical protein n=1 Tax=Kitasatospora sp. NPDC058048 TaxID=3346313 RepID=UPI0036DCD3E9
MAFFVVYACYTLVGAPRRLWPVALVGACLVLASVLRSRPWPPRGTNLHQRLSGVTASIGRAAATLLALGLLIGIWAAGPWSTMSAHRIVLDDRVAVISSCLLLTVFCGGKVALWVTHHVKVEVEALSDANQRTHALDFMHRGLVIGWLERGVLFAFLIAGHSEAAALALAAKSLARTPELDKGGKYVSEFFLLGTLTSVSTALAMGVVARLAMGLSPL